MYWFINIIDPMNMAMPIFRHTHLCAIHRIARRNSAMPTASPGAVAGTGTPPWPRPATMPMIFAVPYGFHSRLVDQKVTGSPSQGDNGDKNHPFFRQISGVTQHSSCSRCMEYS